ncbi:MAG: MauE/DoxX family redox-associated membrane protein [Bacteroidia bacterium]
MISHKFLKVLAIVFSVLLGLVFIFSAISKLYPIEPFEYTFVDMGIAGWQSSLFIARSFIGLELACGILLLANLWLRKFTIPFVIALLIIFNIYLGLQIYKFGNNGNCGCFGELLQLTPLEGILKNIVLILISAFIYVYHKGLYFTKIKLVTAFVILTSLAMPFILNTVDIKTSAQHYSGELNYRLDIELLYNDEKNKPPQVELRKGKWVIVFMSLTCPHCRIAARKFHIMKAKNPDLPIHMVLNGEEANLEAFFNNTRAQNVSWSRFNGAQKFIKLAGTQLPSIIWTNNSTVENKTKYIFTHQEDIEAWINK